MRWSSCCSSGRNAQADHHPDVVDRDADALQGAQIPYQPIPQDRWRRGDDDEDAGIQDDERLRASANREIEARPCDV